MTEVAAGDRIVSLSDNDLVDLYGELLLPRLIEEKMLRLLRQGRLSKWFSGIGQEAIAVGVAWALQPDDWILPMHRNLGVWTTRGVDLDRLFRQLLARDGGFTKGRDRTFHFGTPSNRVVGMISHLGAMQPVADGLALAATLRGERRVAATFLGEGATSEGDVHEAMNLAAVWKLPVLFVLENNGYGLSTPTNEQYACVDLADRGVGYGIPGVVCDGNDITAVVEVVAEAAARARAGDGPSLLEFKTFRMRGHEEASGTAYVPPELFDEWARRDPIVRLEAVLDERGLLSGSERQELRDEMKADIDELVAAALLAPAPTSTADRESGDVFTVAPATSGPAPRPMPGPERELRYLDAITEGLREAMRADPSIVLIGQDIAEYGGAFKATLGFLDEFGRARVRNTPIIESAALGAALGLALDGFRPMIELQFGDFITCGFNQIVNNLATTHYRWGAAVPVVIRAPVGGGMGAGPFHSQDIEGWFTHVAGLKVVAPATPADAKGLLLSAFGDGNPVLYLEHKYLYRSASGPVPEGWHTVPIGRAAIARAGTDATVVTYGVGVVWAVEAADRLARDDGVEVEVIDLRSLRPWDTDTVLGSVERTGRALVLHEAPVTGGFGGEVAATIGERAFSALDAPVLRLGALDTPVPFAKTLEAVHSPRDRVASTLRDLLAY
ncbi:MAG: alpha-ketoacid dehydrogenase subunit alpha/beta [Acidimicrobiales bacterium]